MSTWYAAHVVMYVKYKEGEQKRYPVWENVVLLEADSPEAAFQQAEAIGREGEGDSDGTFRWRKRPARWVFAGVRKLTVCENGEEQPTCGTEVTYLEMEVRAEKFGAYMRSERVGVVLSEGFADDGPEQPRSLGNGQDVLEVILSRPQDVQRIVIASQEGVGPNPCRAVVHMADGRRWMLSREQAEKVLNSDIVKTSKIPIELAASPTLACS